MTWLQKRLDELAYTHEDFRRILAKKGIKRVRATITGWANGKPIKYLCDPDKSKIFAKALNWNLLELFVAAGYDFEVPIELIPLINHYNDLPSSRRALFMLTLRQFTQVAGSLTEEETKQALDGEG